MTLGCQTSRQPKTDFVRRSQPLLGTFVVISAYGQSHHQINDAIDEAFAEIRRVDNVMSLHRDDSELARLNAAAGIAPVAVSAELFAVISNALDMAQATEGSFDPTIKPLVEKWGFLWKEHRLPDPMELQAVLPLVNYRLVKLDPPRRTVCFEKPGLSLDLNGIAKGYAVDRAVEKLQHLGITNAMVRAGGDLRVVGSPPGRDCWRVQLEDPLRKGRRRTIPLRDAAVSTSGNYENFFFANGRRYGHILNPRTGYPVEGVAACSVIAPTCMESDAWATALLVYGPKKSFSTFAKTKIFRLSIPDVQSGVGHILSNEFPDDHRN